MITEATSVPVRFRIRSRTRVPNSSEGSAQKAKMSSPSAFSVGSWVEVAALESGLEKSKSRAKFRRAEIAVDNENGTWDVIFDDGDEEDAVPSARLRKPADLLQRKDLMPTSGKAVAGLAQVARDKHKASAVGGGSAAGSAEDHLAEIIPGLYLGDYTASRREDWLRERGINAILSCTTEAEEEAQSKKQHEKTSTSFAPARYRFALLDTDSMAEHGGVAAFQRNLDVAVDFLRAEHDMAGRAEDGNDPGVLVHCMAGRSRSATAVLAYLTATATPGGRRMPGMRLRDAIDLVVAKRNVMPNPGFLRALAERESAQNGRGPT